MNSEKWMFFVNYLTLYVTEGRVNSKDINTLPVHENRVHVHVLQANTVCMCVVNARIDVNKKIDHKKRKLWLWSIFMKQVAFVNGPHKFWK